MGLSVPDPRAPRTDADQADDADFAPRAAGASAWSVGSMGGMLFLRFLSNVLLARFLLPEQFGVVAILRIILLFLEQISDVGIRGSVIYHPQAVQRSFLNTAWTLQIVRGFVLWGACCLLAGPATLVYPDMPILRVLLPIVGLEAISDGFMSVGVFVRQRCMKLRLPVILDWLELFVNVAVTLVWASFSPTVWALVAGPLVGGTARTVASHVLLRDVRLRLQWDHGILRELAGFGKWVVVGTCVVFLAQQFHTLYLAKMVPVAILGVYERAWTFVNQGTKVLSVISNLVLFPLFAQYRRVRAELFAERTLAALGRFLPACLLVCVPVGIGSPALFGYLYPNAFLDAGLLGQWLAVVVWFMILQQVPRSALLSLGLSRGVAVMAATNAMVTIAACVAGFALGSRLAIGFGSTKGLIVGNALGNLAGCVAGAVAARRAGVVVGRAMLRYSLGFVALLLLGISITTWITFLDPGASERFASLVATLLVAAPLFLWNWRVTFGAHLRPRNDPSTVPAP